MKKPSDSSFLAEMQKKVHEALKAWRASTGNPDNLLENLSLVQQKRRVLAHENGTLRLATNQVLMDGMKELALENAVGEEILQLRFLAGHSLIKVSNKVNVSVDTVSRLQREAIHLLTKIIHRQELAYQANHVLAAENQLPPRTYEQLFGLKEAQTKLVKQLTQATTPWVVTIVGIGGIGKTALADSVSREIIRRFCFDQVVWLHMESFVMNGRSAPDNIYHHLINQLAERLCPEACQTMPMPGLILQIRHILKKRPYLIVVDNLESLHDIAFLLDYLNDLANPSKFLLTTRTHPAEKTASFSLSLEELPRADSIALLRHYIQKTGVTGGTTATEADLLAIYGVVGGNPYALKLVVNLLDLLPLNQILAHLQQGQNNSIDDLYRHIYWQTWQTLSPEARALLKTMPLVSEMGGDTDYLRTLSGLSESQFWPTLLELRHRSLIEVRGTLHNKQYSVHRLTETFLHTEIIHLPIDKLPEL